MWRKLYYVQPGQSGEKKNSCPWQESNPSFQAIVSNYTNICIKKDIKIFSMGGHGGLRYDTGLTLRRFQISSLARFLYRFSANRLKPSHLPKIKLWKTPSWYGAHTKLQVPSANHNYTVTESNRICPAGTPTSEMDLWVQARKVNIFGGTRETDSGGQLCLHLQVEARGMYSVGSARQS